MADRKDFGFKQKVKSTELDAAFDGLEQADWNIATDIGLFGILDGMVVTQNAPVADETVDASAPGISYDQLGRRVRYGTDQDVDVSEDVNGVPTEVITAGKVKWVSLFIRFKRLASDKRTDGANQEYWFEQQESYEWVVRQGAEADPGGAVPPPLQAQEILVVDILRAHGVSQILDAHIFTTRRQGFTYVGADNISVVAGAWQELSNAALNVQEALDSVDSVLHDHFTGADDKHAAAHITSTAYEWIGADNLQSVVQEVVDDLASQANLSPGAMRIGGRERTGFSIYNLGAGNLSAQLNSLLTYLNHHVVDADPSHESTQIYYPETGTWRSGEDFTGIERVGSAILKIITDLAAFAGATRVGAQAQTIGGQAVTNGSIFHQIGEILALLAGKGAIATVNTWGQTQTLDGDPCLIVEESVGGVQEFVRQDGSGARARIYFGLYNIWITVNAGNLGASTTRDDNARDSFAVRIMTHSIDQNSIKFFKKNAGASTWDSSTGWDYSYELLVSEGRAILTGSGAKDKGYWSIYHFAETAGIKNVAAPVSFHSLMSAVPAVVLTVDGSNKMNVPSANHITTSGFMVIGITQALVLEDIAYAYGTYEATIP